MQKKIIKIILLFAIALTIILISNCCEANSGDVSFSVSSGRGSIGDEVSIDINLDNNSNFASTNLVLTYDTNNLEYVSYTKGTVLETGAMSIVKNNSDTGKVALGYVSDPNNVDGIIQSGNIVKIVFKIKSNSVQVTNLGLECTSLKDDSGADITTTISNGKIEITSYSQNNSSNENIWKGQSSEDNSKAETILPKAGILKKTEILMFFIFINISIILYRKYKFMKEI